MAPSACIPDPVPFHPQSTYDTEHVHHSDSSSNGSSDTDDSSEEVSSDVGDNPSDDEDDDSDFSTFIPSHYPVPTRKRKTHSRDDLAHWTSGPVAQIKKREIINKVPRGRRNVALPYSMQTVSERDCDLCGPPFKVYSMEELVGKSVCSFECVKRYCNEVWYMPWGLKLNQTRCRRSRAIFGREGLSPVLSN